MRLRFTKMHGAGNDFVVLNGVTQQVQLSQAHLRALANRHFGVGADQILLVEPALPVDGADIDFRYRIFNADGNEVEHCGNGARCFVRFAHDQGLTDKATLRVKTVNGVVEPTLLPDGNVRVDMGPPRFEPEAVAFNAQGLSPRACGLGDQWPLELAGTQRWVALASMGNPHAVQRVDDVDTAPVAEEGALTVNHPRFAHGVNAGFLQVVDRSHVRLRVFERGAGETLACGTGACAAVALGIRLGWLDNDVQLLARGGQLRLQWAGGATDSVLMAGNAITVFESELDTEALVRQSMPR